MQYLSDMSGVAVGALAVLLFYKLSVSHIRNQTQVLREMKEMLSVLIHIMQNQK